MATLQPLDPIPAVQIEQAEEYELLCPEAGRTEQGLAGTVVPKNGAFSGTGHLVYFAVPASCASGCRAVAEQIGAPLTGVEKSLPLLYEAVEKRLQQQGQRRKGRAAFIDGGQAAASRPLTDLGNAERLIDRHGKDLLYCYRWKEWLAFDGTRWQRDQAGAVARMARDTVRGIYQEAAARERADERIELSAWAQTSESRRHIEAMIALAESFVPVAPHQLDADPWLLNCANGTVELRTGTLRAHRREDLLTKWTAVAYDAEARCPRFECFVADIMAAARELVDFLQRALGYSLTGDCREQCLFLLHGSGSNGKSLLLAIVQAALGDYALQAVSDLLLAKRFDSHPTERADLFAMRFVATIEVEEGRRLAESLTKQLTGGDRIRARRMFQDFWEFTPTHKIWLAANHKPIIRGTDTAIWRRIHLIPFTVRFALPGQQATGGAAVNEADTRKADPALGDKLREELPGLLAWLVRGCVRWQAEGLQPPEAVKQATDAYRVEMDVLAAFLDECCLVKPSARIKAQELHAAYRTWCERSGEEAQSQKALAPLLMQRGFWRQRTNLGFIWHGLGLLAGPEPEPEPEPGPGAGAGAASGSMNHGEPSRDKPVEKRPYRRESRSTVHHGSQGSPRGARPPDSGAHDGAAGVATAGPLAMNLVNDSEPYPDSGAIDAFPEGSGSTKVHHGSPTRSTMDTTGVVWGVSENPKTPHPTAPCPKGHLEWEHAHSDPHRGEPRWHGYVCRGCRPVDQYGCWLPWEACDHGHGGGDHQQLDHDHVDHDHDHADTLTRATERRPV